MRGADGARPEAVNRELAVERVQMPCVQSLQALVADPRNDPHVHDRRVLRDREWPDCPRGAGEPLTGQEVGKCLLRRLRVARSPVERDSYSSREIELVPDAEAPGRFVGMLAALLEGLRLIGLDDDTAWRLVAKVAMDSMPAQRRKVIQHLAAIETSTAPAVATVLGLPTTTARRTLEDLAAHGVVLRVSGGEGKADTWRLHPDKRLDYAAATVPEMSEAPMPIYTQHAFDDFSGTVGKEP